MDWISLESRQNPAVKQCAALAENKSRAKEGLFLAEGVTLLFDFARENIFPEKLFLSKDAIAVKEKIDALLSSSDCRRYLVLPHVFEKLTTEKGSQGVVSLYSVEKITKALPIRRHRSLIALECVQDPGNVGTVLRTAAAFGFDGVCLVGGADPFGVKTVRASMGALCRIPVLRFPSTSELFDYLEEKGVSSVAACLSATAKPIEACDLSHPVCIWIGNEGKGLSEEAQKRANECGIIPMEQMESLNAAVAASVFMWEVKRRNL